MSLMLDFELSFCCLDTQAFPFVSQESDQIQYFMEYIMLKDK